MTCKTVASNGLDSIERVHATDADLDTYMQGRYALDKQALKAGAIANPVVVETKASATPGVVQTQTEPPREPAQQSAIPTVCPACGKNSCYERKVVSAKQAGWLGYNKKLNVRVGDTFIECKTCKHVEGKK